MSERDFKVMLIDNYDRYGRDQFDVESTGRLTENEAKKLAELLNAYATSREGPHGESYYVVRKWSVKPYKWGP